MKEKLTIQNFAGIEYLELELNQINILIGPQAVGKSVTAKLFYFFNFFIHEIKIGIRKNHTFKKIENSFLKKFNNYFPKEYLSGDFFIVEYNLTNNVFIKLSWERNTNIPFLSLNILIYYIKS